jgi:hypothetical protein
VVGVEAALTQRHLDHAPEPRGIERNLLQTRVGAGARNFTWKGTVHMLVPQPAEPKDAFGSSLHTLVLS